MARKPTGAWSTFPVTVASGIFAGAVLFEILPEAARDNGWPLASALTLTGLVAWSVLKRITDYFSKQYGLAIVTAMAFWLHSGLEGTVTALSFSAGFYIGLSVAVGMFLHLLPEFLALLGILRGERVSTKGALAVQLVGVTVLLGSFGFVYRFVGLTSDLVLPAFEAVGGGAFLYIAFSSFWKRRSGTAVVGVAVGLVAIVLWRLIIK